MDYSYNLILKHLGIVLWKLRCPVILTQKKTTCLLIKLKLLIISDVLISLNDLFLQDVIQSMNLSQKEVYIITVDQINNLILPKKKLNYCWWMGIDKLCNYHCLTFNTPSLSILKYDIDAKRDLWNQIYLCLNMNSCH